MAKGSYLYMLIEECFHDYKIDRCLYVLHVKYDDIYIDCILNIEYHSHPYTMSTSLISLNSPVLVFHWATEATGQVQAEANATYNATAYAEATYTVVDSAPGI